MKFFEKFCVYLALFLAGLYTVTQPESYRAELWIIIGSLWEIRRCQNESDEDE